jgi:archaetidylinositol phosphate synthase
VGYLPGWMWAILAITGCLLVSYVRARSEAAGSGKLDVGVAERGERLLILAVGGIIGLVGYAVVVIAILTHLTVIQRLIVARSRLETSRSILS